ncbi:uncharacterized protein L3040_005418 [Drepanopeziza brunnea f. sp. 'multigermtubi']|uniref:Uncharacterized protein n=1 Tax=Marssonina brunnea f. sp. multigermtubi (strain MB_m1) TaxID=1072389 RepID=K1XN95_MARBU|nr:uncharacterized protein MBM_08170 [Drepanopeziza brunnea f. sp. 'multigermtubi' MB_m1]EKD13969.1 hypothetical protein MBM_08170 [Drepanopeziza brunnea f. sp. 'multigermtubi' MB_m1]KAJ5040859.1 hypothetical protein L3040_005418 [Drepanopeziza brunnea f. sp. 'multigermtubi']
MADRTEAQPMQLQRRYGYDASEAIVCHYSSAAPILLSTVLPQERVVVDGAPETAAVPAFDVRRSGVEQSVSRARIRCREAVVVLMKGCAVPVGALVIEGV